jgi:hypothetical protein
MSAHRGPSAVVAAALVALLVGQGAAAPAPPPAFPAALPSAERQRLEEIVRRAFASTRMAIEPYPARPEIFEYLLDHPEFATHVTRALRLARYRIWSVPGGLALDDGWGTKGEFRMVHAERGLRLAYARGRYEQAILPDIAGQAVVLIEYDFRRDGQGHTVVATATAGYVQVEGGFLRAVGTLAGPLVQRKADREARQLLKVFMRVMRAIEDDPALVYEKVAARPDVPKPELEEFRRLLRIP